MPVVHTADAYAVEQVPIERIELGDLDRDCAANGEPRYWQVQAKRFNYVAGESTEDQAQRSTRVGSDARSGLRGYRGHACYRIIPAPRQQQDAAKAPADAPDNTNASKTWPTKIDKLT
jgi:hypothetical protein